MIYKDLNHFDILQICQSGQCFRMEQKAEGLFSVIAGNRYLEVGQSGNQVSFDCSEEDFEGFWKHYFDLDTDYGAYISQVDPKDLYLNQAVAKGLGIRILKQDLWETTVSFLISQQNNIVRIRRCIDNICRAYGEKRISAGGEEYYAFPLPEALADLEENALMECNLGYRSKYVVRAAKSVVKGELDLEAIALMPYGEAKEALLNIFGVGKKVADCICLFSLHQLEAFPEDTHIRQALQKHYEKGFPFDKYQAFSGVLQQYIFYHELMGSD